MSFTRVQTKNPSQPSENTVPRRRIKPDWDATVNDLSVYKATQDELARRKTVVQSHNLDLVKEQQLQKRISQAQKKRATSAHRAVLKEILGSGDQIADTLAKSDRILAVVHDLFGDDPFKYQGMPNVTDAPKIGKKSSTTKSMPGPTVIEATRMDELSGRIMDRYALNDDQDHSSYTSDSDDDQLQYNSTINLDRLKELLVRAAEEEDMYEQQRQMRNSQGKHKQHGIRDAHKEHHSLPQGHLTPDRDPDGFRTPEKSGKVPPDTGAINDTIKVKKSQARTKEATAEKQPEEAEESLQTTTDLDTLHQALGKIEDEIGEYEDMTNKCHSHENVKKNTGPPTLNGFTGRLVQAVYKMAGYMKNCESRLRAEQTARYDLEQQYHQQRSLLNALIAKMQSLQDEYIGLTTRFTKHCEESTQLFEMVLETIERSNNTSNKGCSISPTSDGPPAMPEPPSPASRHDFQPLCQDNVDGEWIEPARTNLTIHSSAPQATHPNSVIAPGAWSNWASWSQQTCLQPWSAVLDSPQQMTGVRTSSTQHGQTVPEYYRHSVAHSEPGWPNHPENIQQFTTSNSPENIQQFNHPENYEQFTASTSSISAMYPQHAEPVSNLPLHYPQTSRVRQGGPESLHYPQASSARQGGEVEESLFDLTEEQQRVLSNSLTRQIEDLNRQHVEAQNKLMTLMQQQAIGQKQYSQPGVSAVSPPVSPISVNADTAVSTPLKVQTNYKRSITVALPTMKNSVSAC